MAWLTELTEVVASTFSVQTDVPVLNLPASITFILCYQPFLGCFWETWGCMGPITQTETTLAGWLPGSGRHTWIPGPVIKASLVLPCLRSCAANCAIAKEPRYFQKHACPFQGCTTYRQHCSLPCVKLSYADCSSVFLLLSPHSQQPSHQDRYDPRRWWQSHCCPLGPRSHWSQSSAVKK